MIEVKKEKVNQIKKILKEKEYNMDQKREEKLNLVNDLADLKSNFNGLSIMSDNAKTQLDQMNIEYATYKEQIKYQNSVELEVLQNKKTLEKECIEINNMKDKLYLKLKNTNEVLKNLQNKSQSINKEIQIKQSKAKVLTDMDHEYEGYYKSVRKLMLERKKYKILRENIYGVIAELINVPPDYVLAIERALGSSIQNIVVKNEFTAQECIKLLTNHRWGRATFLPIEVIKGRKINQELSMLKRHKGFIGVASDLIRYDHLFKQVIEQLLGRIIIVGEMDDGISLSRQLNQKFKIVTLNGEVFNPGGSIVGGSNSINNTGILSRQKEIKEISNEINILKNSNDQLNVKIDALMIQKKEMYQNEVELTKSINKNNIDRINLNSSLKQIEIEKQRIDNEIIKINNKIKLFHLKLDELQEKGIKYKKEISIKNTRLNSMNVEISSSMNNNEEDKGQLDQLNDKIIQFEIALAKIKQKKIEYKNQLTLINQSIEKHQNNIQEKDMELENYDKQMDENKSKINKKDDYIKVILKEKLNNEKQVDVLLKSKEETRIEIEIYEERLKEYNKQLVVSNNALHKIIIQLNKMEMEMENLKNTIYEDYKTTYNMALGYKTEIIHLQNVYSEIKNYKNQISELGNINIDSIEEYERVLERHTFLKKQQEDLVEAKMNLHVIIEEITSTMEKQFKEQFNKIKEEFNNVFSTLFQGGYAKVYLSEPNNALISGVEIEVQPPGKKLQNLLLLSGGERALTAIALLFAILKVRPTPFCILDEIEAALDESNVNRFASFLKEFSESIQFIAVTHRKGTMEIADILYGVTMEEQGVSKLISVKLTEIAS